MPSVPAVTSLNWLMTHLTARITIRVIEIIMVQEEPDPWQRCHSNTGGGPPTNSSGHPVGVEVCGESACGVRQRSIAASVKMRSYV